MKQSKMPNLDDIRAIPSHIINIFLKVSLYINVIHVNIITILVGTSKYIRPIHSVCIRKKAYEKFLKAILIMIRKYRARDVFDHIIFGADKVLKYIKSVLEERPYQITLAT